MKHYDLNELIAYRLDPGSAPAGLEEHLALCGECAETLEASDALDEALRHDETWEAVTCLSGAPVVGLSEALSLEARIHREDAEARRRLKGLTASRLRLLGARLPSRPMFRHAGTVRILCRTAHGLHERNPRLSLEVATQAYAVALKLDATASTPPRYCLGIAARERANALRYLGRFTEALEALATAEGFFDSNAAADPFDLAIVRAIRATVFHETGRFAEGAANARAAGEVFGDYGDRFRQLNVFMLEAGCRMSAGDLASAGGMFERAVELAVTLGDSSTQARGLSNSAMVSARAGDLDRAEPRYLEALLLFDELGLTTEHARTSWELANLAVKRGRLAEGANLLGDARAMLSTAGMTNDHALATLDWAAVRLALGSADGVAEACQKIVVIFESEGMIREARRALAHLHEALALGTATADTVRSIRAFIEELPRNPNRRFAAAPA